MKIFEKILFVLLLVPLPAFAATSVPFTVNMSEAVNVVTTGGTPRIAVDVGGATRYASYTGGTGTSALTFTYAASIGDVDLDGVTLTSPMELNGGTIKDLAGNNATLTFTLPTTTGIKVDYPSLGLDFVADADGRYTVNGTAYNDLAALFSGLGGSFSRGSTATYYDSSGVLQTASSGTPRFTYDPSSHVARGLLMEEAQTNLQVRSAEIDNAGWSKTNVTVTPNATTAPDGTNSAELVAATAVGANVGMVRQNIAGTFSTYTFSIYAKAGTTSKFRIQPNSQVDSSFTGFVAECDLSAGTVSTYGVYGTAYGSISATITNVGNGWYRCATRYTLSGTTFNQNITNWVYSYGQTGGVIGDSVYLWGGQLEIGALATSYIPTAASAVARAADVLLVPTTGWYSATAHTATAKSIVPIGAVNYGFVFEGTAIQGLTISYPNASNYELNARNIAGANGVYSSTVINAAGTQNGLGLTYDASLPTFAANGTIATSNGSAANLGTPANFYIGSRGGTTGFLNGTIQNIKYYPARVTNAQLQLLTQ